MVSMSSLMMLSILVIITLNSLSDKLLAPISSSFPSGEFSYSFILGVCLSILAVSLCLFPCIRLVCKDSGVDLCQTLLVTGPGQPVWSYQWSTACGCLCWACLCAERIRLCTKDHVYQHKAQERVS